MSDSGFTDEAPRRAPRIAGGDRRDNQDRGVPRVPGVGVGDRGNDGEHGGDSMDPSRPARPGSRAVTVLFVVVVVALVAFGVWAWTSRVHGDDLTAYQALETEITVMDRSFIPLGHSEIPPCRDRLEGAVTRSYPASTGPAADELVGYLGETGWAESAPTPPAVARLTKTVGGHELTLTIVGFSRSSLAMSLRAVSSGSSVGCLLR